MTKSKELSFWVPFAGRNHLGLGTRIEVNPELYLYGIHRLPVRRRRQDQVISNGRHGLAAMKTAIASASDSTRAEDIFLNIAGELLLVYQRQTRRLQAEEAA